MNVLSLRFFVAGISKVIHVSIYKSKGLSILICFNFLTIIHFFNFYSFPFHFPRYCVSMNTIDHCTCISILANIRFYRIVIIGFAPRFDFDPPLFKSRPNNE